MEENKDKVSFNDIQIFQTSDNDKDKAEALKKDPNSRYNSFINENPNEPNPSDSGNKTEK